MTSLAKEALMLHPTLFRLEVVQDSVVDRVAHKVVDRRLPKVVDKVVDRVHQSPLQAHHHQTLHLQAQLLPTLDKVCKFQQYPAHVLSASDPKITTATKKQRCNCAIGCIVGQQSVLVCLPAAYQHLLN